MKTFYKHIDKLNDNEIFVFGSNLGGTHGSGAAHTARRFGAKIGVYEGLSGQTYAIPTKNLFKGNRSVPLKDIEKSIVKFLSAAKSMSDKTFFLTPIGTGLAGYTMMEIAGLFVGKIIPGNVVVHVDLYKEIMNIQRYTRR